LANSKTKKCKNCNEQVLESAQFCSSCGQSFKPKKRAFPELISSFFSEILSIYKKSTASLLAIFIPGKLTRDYFNGKQDRYYNPWRIFIISFILLFLFVGKLPDDIVQFSFNQFDIIELDYESLCESVLSDNDIYKLVGHSKDRNISGIYENSFLQTCLDSSQKVFNHNVQAMFLDSFELYDDFIVSYYDLQNNEYDTLLKMYNFDISQLPLYGRFEIKIAYKTNLINHASLINKFIIDNLNLLLLFMVPLLGLVLKLMYIRRKHYYIEHFILSLHNTSAINVILILGIIAGKFLEFELIIGLNLVLIVLYYFVSFKRYYQQSWFKTIMKTLIFFFLYTLVFALTSILFISLGVVFG